VTVTTPRENLQAGDRVRLTACADRFPHFLVQPGGEGTVVLNEDDSSVAIRMDAHIPGCEEWDNEITWVPEDEAEWENLPVERLSGPTLVWQHDDEGTGITFHRYGVNDVEASCFVDRVQSLAGSMVERDGNFVYVTIDADRFDEAVAELAEGNIKVQEG